MVLRSLVDLVFPEPDRHLAPRRKLRPLPGRICLDTAHEGALGRGAELHDCVGTITYELGWEVGEGQGCESVFNRSGGEDSSSTVRRARELFPADWTAGDGSYGKLLEGRESD